MKSYTTWFLYLIHIDTYIRNQLTLLLAYKRYTTWHNYSKVETWQAVDLVNSPGHVDIRSRGAGSLLDGIRRKIVGGRQLLEYLSKIKSLRVVNSGREKAQPGRPPINDRREGCGLTLCGSDIVILIRFAGMSTIFLHPDKTFTPTFLLIPSDLHPPRLPSPTPVSAAASEAAPRTGRAGTGVREALCRGRAQNSLLTRVTDHNSHWPGSIYTSDFPTISLPTCCSPPQSFISRPETFDPLFSSSYDLSSDSLFIALTLAPANRLDFPARPGLTPQRLPSALSLSCVSSILRASLTLILSSKNGCTFANLTRNVFPVTAIPSMSEMFFSIAAFEDSDALEKGNLEQNSMYCATDSFNEAFQDTAVTVKSRTVSL
ncbi:hypothetical protein RRG08_012932 [Elysia crispata]|uniref:Uncharacterized protein n=1 Tax=Elysia crispata TaxID=231223 RepID=A0AAE0ZZR6_9GAST|nr:hypothetical protein RRG08_012932 [Elysia crispata]